MPAKPPMDLGHNRLVLARHGYMLYPAHDIVVGRSIEYYGEYYESEVALFRQIVRDGDIVIDAGANIGAHTVPLSHMVGPGGRVLAFEPMRAIHQILCANIALNGLGNVDCLHAALDSADGVVGVTDVHLGTEGNYGGIALHDRPGDIEVATRRLDSLFRWDRLRFMKIDVEGMESAVLGGAAGVIERLRPILYVENDRTEKSPELLRRLRDLGYTCYWHLARFHNPGNFFGRAQPLHDFAFLDWGEPFGSIGFAVNLLCMPQGTTAQGPGLTEVASLDEHPFLRAHNARLREGIPIRKIHRPRPGPGNSLEAGVAAHRTGQYADAEALYRRTLAEEPAHPDGWHLLGLIRLQERRLADARDFVRRALAAGGARALFLNSLGEAQRLLGAAEEAERAYRMALVLEPERAEAHINLAAAARKRGRIEVAERAARYALALAPQRTDAIRAMGHVHLDRWQAGAARACYRRVLVEEPDHVETLDHLGRAERQLANPNAAVALMRRAVRVEPANAEHLLALGDLLAGRLPGDPVAAAACYRRLVTVQPERPDGLSRFGRALIELRRFDEAGAAFRRSLAVAPDHPATYGTAAHGLMRIGRADDARARCRMAVALQPDNPDLYANLGIAAITGPTSAALYAEGERACQRGRTIDPRHVAATNHLGMVLAANGRLAEAEAAFHTVLGWAPDNAEAHFNLSLALLKAGRLAEGWDEYEWRWRIAPLVSLIPGRPHWKGEDPAGRTILLVAEQGNGDTLHFARYAPLLARRGARVLLAVQPGLVRLCRSLDGVSEVFDMDKGVPTAVDYQATLLSLPRLFGTALESIPAQVPYLRADPRDVSAWASRLPAGGLRVGLVWSGDPRTHLPDANATDRRRSVSLQDLTPLAAVPGVSWVSLQKGGPAAQAKTPPAGMALFDPMDEVGDFADTAAVVENLDLVITVDTSVAHLAGALGKPVWVLSRYDGCWRWLTDRDDSPWYPTMSLFRQTAPGDWRAAVQAVADQLQELSG